MDGLISIGYGKEACAFARLPAPGIAFGAFSRIPKKSR